jgi:hypothetical protein
MAVFVYLSPEIGCFLGPVPVVTKLPKFPMRGHGIPPAGVGQHKRASLFSVEGTIAYLMDLMRIQLLPFESHRATPQMEARHIEKTTDLELPPGGNKIDLEGLGFWKLDSFGQCSRVPSGSRHPTRSSLHTSGILLHPPRWCQINNQTLPYVYVYYVYIYIYIS